MDAWIDGKLQEDTNWRLRAVKTRMLAALPAPATTEPAVIVASALARARVLALDEREAFVVHGYSAEDTCAIFTRSSCDRTLPVLTNWLEQKAVRFAYRFFERNLREDAEALQAHKAALGEHCGKVLRPTVAATDAGVPSVETIAAAGISSGEQQAEQECGEVSPVAGIVEDASGAGNGSLVAMREAKAFTPLLRIPGRLLFNLDTLRRFCDLGMVLNRAAWKKMLDDEGEALLLTCFIYEAAKWRATGKSNWAPILKTCPAHFPGVPTMWGAGELQHLAGTSILDEVAMKQATLAAFASSMQSLLSAVADKHTPIFEEVFSALATSLAGESQVDAAVELTTAEKIAHVFSEEQYQWARCVFDSRSFHLLHGGNRVLVTLAPVADMINHTAGGSDVISRRIDETTGEFILELGAGFTAAEVPREVVMCYGPLQTWELLLSYGFIPSDDGGVNPHDRLPFTTLDALINVVAPAEGDEEAAATDDGYDEQRRAIIERFQLDLVDQLFTPVDGVVPPVVLAILRLCQAEADDFPQLHENPFAAGPEYLDERVAETLRSFALSFIESVAVDDDEAVEGADDTTAMRCNMAFELRRRLSAIASKVARTA